MLDVPVEHSASGLLYNTYLHARILNIQGTSISTLS